MIKGREMTAALLDHSQIFPPADRDHGLVPRSLHMNTRLNQVYHFHTSYFDTNSTEIGNKKL